MNVSHSRNIGAYVKPAMSIVPVNSQAAAAFALEGAAVDRMPAVGKQFDSCVFHLMRGATSSNPDPHTVTAKLQHSDVEEDGDTWSDIPDTTLGPLGEDNTDAQMDVDLSGAKRYVRAVATVAFTGGTTPAIPVTATITLGGAKELPV
jgi:hypothetical protein